MGSRGVPACHLESVRVTWELLWICSGRFWSYFLGCCLYWDDPLLRCCCEIIVYLLWSRFRTSIGFLQFAVNVFGISMGLQTVESLMQDSCGIPLGSLKVFLRRCCGIAAVLLWDHCDTAVAALIFLWNCCGIDAGVLWTRCGPFHRFETYHPYDPIYIDSLWNSHHRFYLYYPHHI